jgi:hypothetical protein
MEVGSKLPKTCSSRADTSPLKKAGPGLEGLFLPWWLAAAVFLNGPTAAWFWVMLTDERVPFLAVGVAFLPLRPLKWG